MICVSLKIKKHSHLLTVIVHLNFRAGVTFVFAKLRLSDLASQAIFRFRYNIHQFELTMDTTCDQYKYVANSKKIPFQKLVPNTYPTLHCNIIRKRNVRDKKIS